jgi:protein-disulfide isomerase
MRVVGVAAIVAVGAVSFSIVRELTTRDKITIYRAEEVRFGLAGYPFRGDSSASVVVVDYFDFSCHYCDSMHYLLDTLLEKYPRGVKVYEKAVPLMEKKQGELLAQALLAAKRQGRYWEAVGRFLSLSKSCVGGTTTALLDSVLVCADELHLDRKRLQSDMRSKPVRAELRAAIAEAEQYGVAKLPTLFINGRRIEGVGPLQVYTAALDHLLAASGTAGAGQTQ